MPTLVIGNKNYSSWSLRAWLYLRQSHISFAEQRLALFSETWPESIQRFQAAGKVPILIDGSVTVWDSLAIIEYVHEHWPEAARWPQGRAARALARSMVAEMHSGFAAIRSELPQNLRRTPFARALSLGCALEVKRVDALWRECRLANRDDGPFLFGAFSPVDAVFAPVALRFDTYQVHVSDESRSYVETIRSLPAVQEFRADAARETWVIDAIDHV
jgi:glutathione S-transferase